MRFKLPRNLRVVSTFGHSVEFVKDEFTHVPPIMHAQVVELGATPEEELPPEVKPVDTEPRMPQEREDALFAVFETLAVRNRREDFTAGGAPHPNAIAQILGWKPSNRERDIVWHKFRNKETA